MKSLMKLSRIGYPTCEELALSDPNAIGASRSQVGYGVMASVAPSRPKIQPPVGQGDTPLEADRFLRVSIGNKFPVATRFPDPVHKNIGSPHPAPTVSHDQETIPSYSGKFALATRDSDVNIDQPGPGSYNVPSFLDESKRKNKGAIFFTRRNDKADFINHVATKTEKNIYKSLSSAQYCNEIVFGFGCNLQEHLVYGVCLDGMCGKRAFYEDLMVTHNDVRRIVGDRMEAEKQELIREFAEVKKATELMEKDVSLPPLEKGFIGNDNSVSLTPLHIAAYKGDLDSIKTLAKLELDVNAVESNHNRTAAHMAVIRNNAEALRFLVTLFQNVINLDIQDCNGDTPLHIACRAGLESMVEMLCDGGASPTVRNNHGKYPLDEAKTHRTYQVMHLTMQKQKHI